GASRLLLDRRRSDALTPPWPDLVLACGRRSAPIARWIRRRSDEATRLVHLGRPQAPLDAFDLVVTTPQYGLPGRDNVLHNVLPLGTMAADGSERARAVWAPRFASLPRPWIVLLVGGNASSSRLDAATAREVRGRAEALARARGGSLLVATSPRTPPAAAAAVLAHSDVPGLGYRWRADDPENPYPLFLQCAAELVVTGDSASMLADACASGRPVHYLPLPRPAERRPTSALLLRLRERARKRLGE